MKTNLTPEVDNKILTETKYALNPVAFSKEVLNLSIPQFQKEWLDAVSDEDYKRVAISAPTGFGKCFAEGTEVLLHSGETKRVENIVKGDKIMGDDSKPRKVISTTSGVDDLFEVKQKNGKNYTVNSKHILSLVMSHDAGYEKKDNIVDISINEYLKKSNTFKHCAKGFKVSVEYDEKEVPIDPYWLGVWLGDGNSDYQYIHTPEPEVREFIKEYASKINLEYVESKQQGCFRCNMSGKPGKKNNILDGLRRLNLLNNKHIPNIYKINSKKVRLELLAGILDSDGHRKNNCLTIIQKREPLANDIVFLSRSLGFRAHMKKCAKKCQNNFSGEYYRVTISGRTEKIPLKVSRKKVDSTNLNRDPSRTGVEIEYKGKGIFYGFQVEGNNQRFLLSDFTVTHNSECLAVAYPIWRAWREKNFQALIVSSSLGQSTDILKRIKRKMNQSDLLKSKIDKENLDWSKTEIELTNGSKIFCKPYSPNIRGVDVDYVLCVPPSTFIETNKGDKQIRNIEEGDSVKTHTGEFHTVKKVYERDKKHYNLIEIKTKETKIDLTPEHPVYVKRGKRRKFVPANKVRISDMLCYPTRGKIKSVRLSREGDKNISNYTMVNGQFARLLGLFAAEGSFGNSMIRWTFGSHEEKLIEEATSSIKFAFGEQPSVDNHKKTSTTLYLCGNGYRKSFKRWFVGGSKEREIPKFIFDSPGHVKAHFLKGWLDGDGDHNKDRTGKYGTTISKKLHSQLVSLCDDLNLSYSTNVISTPGNCQTSYSLYIKANSMRKLNSVVSGNKQRRYIYYTIKSITKKDKNTKLYNLEVEKDNSYIANGISVHNCDEVSTYKDHSIFNDDVKTRAHAHGTVCVISTPVSETDLLMKLMKRWKKLDYAFCGTYPALVKKGKEEVSIWPEKYSTEWLKRERKEDPHGFKRNYMCKIESGEDALFPLKEVVNCYDENLEFTSPQGEKWVCEKCGKKFDYEIQSCTEKTELGQCNGNLKKVPGAVYFGIDFAMSSGRKADYSVFTVVELVEDKVFIRDMYRYKGMGKEAQESRIEKLYEEYTPKTIFLDQSNMGITFLQSLRQKQLPVKGCKFSASHRAKYLLNLKGMIMDGKIVIPRKERDVRTIKNTDQLIKELVGFEVGETRSGNITYRSTTNHDDCVMSLALAVQGLRKKRPMMARAMSASTANEQ